MLLALLLISQVSCDWVEISQNTYKKEPPRRTTPINRYEEKPEDDRIYRNISIIEKQWNKATIDRVSNIGNIRRVHEPSVSTPSINLRPSKYDSTKLSDTRSTHLNIRRVDFEHPETSVRHPFHEEEIPTKWRETTHREFTTRPSKTGTIKKIQIINSNAENKQTKTTIAIDKDRYDSNKGSDENKIYKEQDENKKFITIADDSTSRNDDDDIYEYRIRNFQRLPTTVQNSHENDLKTKSYFVSTTPVAKTTRIDTIFNKDNTNYFQKIENIKEEDLNEPSLINDFKASNTSTKMKSKFHVTKIEKEKPFGSDDDKISKLNPHVTSNLKDSARVDLNTNVPELSIKNENVKETKKEDVVDRFEEISNTTKGESMIKMWNLVKIVTDTIYKNTHRSFKSKVNYLERLQSTILASIGKTFLKFQERTCLSTYYLYFIGTYLPTFA